MKKNLEEIINYIEEVRSDIKNYVQDKEDHLLQNTNDANSWSPNEVLQHLYKTEIYITELLNRQIERAKKKDLTSVDETTSYLHSLDEFEIEIVNEKFNAPELSKPGGSMDSEVVLHQMGESRSELIKLLREFSQYDMTGIEFPHPAYGRMNMIQWVLFLGKHEERHFNQIKQVLKLSGV